MNAMYYETGSNGKILSRVEKDISVAQLPLDLKEIGDRAFENNRNLNIVHMPDGLEKIGDEAFVNCSFLRDFLIPNSVCKIGKGAFRNCYNLRKIRIPSRVKEIEEFTFADCGSIEEVEFEYGVETIDSNAFMSCAELGKIFLPSSIKSLDEDAFSRCFALDTVVVPVKTFFKEKIYENPFFIKNKVKYDLIYNDISDFKYYYGSLDNYSLHNNNVITVRQATDEEQYLFDEKEKLKSSEKTKTLSKKDVYFLRDGMTEYDIPFGVTEIDAYTFSGLEKLRKVSIPGTVKVIGEGAFQGCHDLEEIEISDGVEYIESDAFLDCFSLRKIVIPNTVKSIGTSCFLGCKNLEDVTLGDNLESLESHAFYQCKKLKTINFPDSLESIEDKSFMGCRSLTSIRLPKNVKTIEDCTFNYCTSLSKIILPENLHEIKSWAFADTAIEELELPIHLKKIDDYVLRMINSLKKVTVHYNDFDELINFVRNNSKALNNFYKEKGKKNIIFIGPELNRFENLLLAMTLNTDAYTFSKDEQPAINENADNGNIDNNRYTGNDEINSILNTIYGKSDYLPDPFKNIIMSKVNETLDEFDKAKEELRPELDEVYKPTLVFITPAVAKERARSKLNAVLGILDRIEPFRTIIEQNNYYLDLAKGVSSNSKENDFVSEDIVYIMRLLPLFPERNKGIIKNELNQILDEYSSIISNEIKTLFDNNALTDPSYVDYRIDLVMKIGELKNTVSTDYDVLQKYTSLQNGLNGIVLSSPNELVDNVLALKNVIESFTDDSFKLEISSEFQQLVDEIINSIKDITQSRDHFSEQEYNLLVHRLLNGMVVIETKISEYNQISRIENKVKGLQPLINGGYLRDIEKYIEERDNEKIKYYKDILQQCLDVIRENKRVDPKKIGKSGVESDILNFYYRVIDDFIEDEKKVSLIKKLIKAIEEQIKRLDSGKYKSNNLLEYLYENIANLSVELMDYHPEIKEHIENFGDSATIPPKK